MGGTAAINVAARLDLAGLVAISAPDQFGLDARDDVANVTQPSSSVAARGDGPAPEAVDFFMQQTSQPKNGVIYEGSAHGTDISAAPTAPTSKKPSSPSSKPTSSHCVLEAPAPKDLSAPTTPTILNPHPDLSPCRPRGAPAPKDQSTPTTPKILNPHLDLSPCRPRGAPAPKDQSTPRLRPRRRPKTKRRPVGPPLLRLACRNWLGLDRLSLPVRLVRLLRQL